jgi:PiT family inorganic phosphate transporter
MLAHIPTASPLAIGVLVFSLVLVLAFEFSNGFHDTANAVATVIYTHSLKPVPAVLLSGTMNFLGVLLGGIAVAYTLVELLPPDVLTPPNGSPAIGMLLSLFLSALIWNVATWYLGIPCSSSHAIIGALLGVGIANSILAARGVGHGVPWDQVWSVGRALLFSPILGFILAGLLFRVVRGLIHDRHLYEETTEAKKPAWWVRGLLICTCGGVSFTHGSNDGQKSIGLIMLTIIGLMPVTFTLNADLGHDQIAAVSRAVTRAAPLIETYGDDEKDLSADAARKLADRFRDIGSMADIPADQRSAVRDAIYRVDSELKLVTERSDATKADKQDAASARGTLHSAVEYVPLWVRALSALCLGFGTVVGYKRIVTTLGERIGKSHLVPAQGASAEIIAAGLIGTAGFSGLPVSTTHIVSSGIAGTMAASGAGVRGSMVRQIILAWVLTLPATILLSGALFYAFSA